jgi:hypothetical protein
MDACVSLEVLWWKLLITDSDFKLLFSCSLICLKIWSPNRAQCSKWITSIRLWILNRIYSPSCVSDLWLSCSFPPSFSTRRYLNFWERCSKTSSVNLLLFKRVSSEMVGHLEINAFTSLLVMFDPLRSTTSKFRQLAQIAFTDKDIC